MAEKLDRVIKDFFEPQLVALGLGEKQVNEQSLEELNQSLDRINDLIKNPEQFGVLRLNYDPVSGFYFGKSTAILTERGPLLDRGILPLLLERKKLILDRIATMVGAGLIFFLGVSEVLAMSTGIKTSDVVNNAFLIVLGYFFGQAVAGAGKRNG